MGDAPRRSRTARRGRGARRVGLENGGCKEAKKTATGSVGLDQNGSKRVCVETVKSLEKSDIT